MNQKSIQERAQIIQLLVEGNSLRSTSRITGASINTIMSLLNDVGGACEKYQKETFINLPCKKVEVDEIWSFIHAKNKNLTHAMPEYAGDTWCWIAIDVDNKLIPCWHVGNRKIEDAMIFISDLSKRMSNKIDLTSDGLGDYQTAVEEVFGVDIDYAVLIKMYDEMNRRRKKYSGSTKKIIMGSPNPFRISTSHIESQNMILRTHIKRFARKTCAHSKKLENHCHAIALHFFYYNFCRIHSSLRVTPAMQIGVSDHVWEIEEIVNLI